MNRQTAEPYVSFIADDAGSFRRPANLPCDTPTAYDWLIGWRCKFRPLFVRVRSYLPEIHLNADEAVNMAVNGLAENKWFINGRTVIPDYIVPPEIGDTR